MENRATLLTARSEATRPSGPGRGLCSRRSFSDRDFWGLDDAENTNLLLSAIVGRTDKHGAKERNKIFFVQREAVIAGLADLHDRQIRGVGLQQKAL